MGEEIIKLERQIQDERKAAWEAVKERVDQARAEERELCIKSLPAPMEEIDFDYANGFNDAIEQSEGAIRALGDE